MASITSVISLFVLLLATYCYAVPIEFTTDKPMLGHDGTHMFVEDTTFRHMMTGDKKVREEHESGSEEHTTDFLIKRDDESETKRTFEHFTVPSVDLTTEMHKIRNMEEFKSESDSDEHTTERVMKRDEEPSMRRDEEPSMKRDEEPSMKRTFEDVSFPSVELTTEMHKIRNIEEHSAEHDDESIKRTFENFSFPTSTSESVEDKEETRSFEDMKFTTERLSHHGGEMESELFTTERIPHNAREFEHDLFTTLESSTEFADRAIRGSPEWFERQARASPEWFERSVRASPEWFERSARNYAEPEVEEEKVLPVKHISLDKIKTFEPSSSVDSYAKTTGLLHEDMRPIVSKVKEIEPIEDDKYTHVEKIIPGTFHETKLLHEEMPHKEVLVNDYGTKVFHEVPHKDLLVNDYETKIIHEVPHKDLLVNDYETKTIHEVPHKDLLVKDYETKVFHDDMPHTHLFVKDYETVKPALDEVKVKTLLTKTESSY